MANTPELKVIYAMLQAQVQVISGLVALNDLTTAQQGGLIDLLHRNKQEILQAMSDQNAQFRTDFQEVLRRVDAETSLIASVKAAFAGQLQLLQDKITELQAQGLTSAEFAAQLHTTVDTMRANDQALADAALSNTPAAPNAPTPVNDPTPAPAPAPQPDPAPADPNPPPAVG